MEFWPALELTDFERQFVRVYKTADKPGVLRRTYKVTINSPEQPTKNLPTAKLSGQIQIARRSRVFGLTFSGNIERFRLQITNASGTLYTLKTPRTQRDPLVTTLIASSAYNADSLGGLTPPLDGTGLSQGVGPYFDNDGLFAMEQPFPLLIDPNWLLMPNETLIFNGTPVPVSLEVDDETVNPFLVLNIAIHVWEFPGMGTADIQTRSVI